MNHYVRFCLAVLIGVTANAQTINLRGTVLNRMGTPIGNATVTLVGQGLNSISATTTGMYSITKNTAIQVPAVSMRTEKILLNKGILELSLSNPSPVKIEVFDVIGNLLKKEYIQNALAGNYRFNIANISRAANLLIIKVSIGKHVMSLQYLPLIGGKYKENQSYEYIIPVGGKMAALAAVDSLRTAANGYMTNTVAISKYDSTVNITLDSTAVTMQLDLTRQTIDGFGINNNWAPALTAAVADSLFDTTKGLGLSILRIGMASSGSAFNSSSWNDIKLAKARGLKYVIGSTWSPPASWKTNNSENDGGYLLPQYYGQWSDRIAAFPALVKSGSGMDLYAMSLGNEPDFASCGMVEPCNGNYPTTLWNDTQVVNFIKVAGPKLHAAGCKVMAPEASEWLHTWSDSSACCSVPSGKPSSNPLKGKGYNYGHTLYKDATAWAQLDILGVHQYDSQIAVPWPSDVPDRKSVWQTEMSGVKYWPEQGPSSDINNGVAVAGWIHNALTVGEANGWCWWWWKATGATNEGLLLSDGTNTKRHYTFGNYTRFVRPGYTRVEITGNIPANVLITAYKGNSTVVIVAINKNTTSVTVPISILGGTMPTSATPWVTSATDNLASKAAIAVSGGILTVTLGATSVTTFVCK